MKLFFSLPDLSEFKIPIECFIFMAIQRFAQVQQGYILLVAEHNLKNWLYSQGFDWDVIFENGDAHTQIRPASFKELNLTLWSQCLQMFLENLV